MIDIAGNSVEDEVFVGGRLSDLAVLKENHLLVLDEANQQLILLHRTNSEWQGQSRQKVADSPVRLVVNRATARCFISSLWSRTVTAVDLAMGKQLDSASLHVAHQRLVSFEPRELCLVHGGSHLIVAGSFAANLAVLDVDDLTLLGTQQLPGHNIRSLATSADQLKLYIAQQELYSLARSTFEDVHWGNLMSNLLVSFPVETVVGKPADLPRRRTVFDLGQPDAGASDPGPLWVGPSGRLAVLLSGVDEVGIAARGEVHDLSRVSVGRRPTAIQSTPDGRLYIADTFSDSISIIDAQSAKRVKQVSLGPHPEPSRAERGEEIFFDGRLSHDGWMSCHTDGHTNGQFNDNLSDGSFGAAKRVLSLLGVGETKPWAWNGRVKTLEQQLTNSIRKTMQGKGQATRNWLPLRRT